MKSSSFVLIIILSFLSVNCSEKSPVEPNYEFYIGVYFVLVELDEYYVSVSSVEEINSSSFQLNGVDVPLNWQFSEYGKEWYSFTRTGDLDPAINYTLGKDYDIYLELNGKEYVSNIHLPDKPIITWPKLDIQSDFTFSWELNDRPFQQTVNMSYFYGEDGFVDKYWHLDGDKRSLTLKKSLFDKLESKSDLWIDISCYNKVKQGKFITISNCWTSSPDFGNNP